MEAAILHAFAASAHLAQTVSARGIREADLEVAALSLFAPHALRRWTHAFGIALPVGLPLALLGLAASCFVLVRAGKAAAADGPKSLSCTDQIGARYSL